MTSADKIESLDDTSYNVEAVSTASITIRTVTLLLVQ